MGDSYQRTDRSERQISSATDDRVKNPFGKSIAENSREFEITWGRTGDIIAIDLKELFGGANFSQLTLNSVDPGHTISSSADSPHEYVMSDGTTTEPVGKVMFSDELLGTSFAQTGKFYLRPNRTRSWT